MVTLDNVKFGYRRRQSLFENLSLKFESGHIYGLLGGNGVGKSTLIKIISGLIFPKSGTVTTLGENPSKRKPSMYSNIFVVPEEFDMPRLSFEKYVATNAPFYPNFSQEMMDYYVKQFNIDPKQNLDRISMGQKKRALIAFAMACRPALLLMDEPTNGLDILAKSVFRHLLASYATPEQTVIISTHQVRDIESLIDSVLILDEKGVVLNADTNKITEKLYFGTVSQGDKPLSKDESLKGEYGVFENISSLESNVNIELLFKASVENREKLIAIFGENKSINQ